jgi:hypothetical protein
VATSKIKSAHHKSDIRSPGFFFFLFLQKESTTAKTFVAALVLLVEYVCLGFWRGLSSVSLGGSPSAAQSGFHGKVSGESQWQQTENQRNYNNNNNESDKTAPATRRNANIHSNNAYGKKWE